MIEFNSRVDKIAKDLQEQIVQGKLKPGERLLLCGFSPYLPATYTPR